MRPKDIRWPAKPTMEWPKSNLIKSCDYKWMKGPFIHLEFSRKQEENKEERRQPREKERRKEKKKISSPSTLVQKLKFSYILTKFKVLFKVV